MTGGSSKIPAEAKNKLITDNDPLNARILKLVTDLGNTVLAKRAANDLHKYVLLGLMLIHFNY